MLFVGQTGSLGRQHGSQVAGFAAVTIAAASLIGGWAGLPLLSTWGLGFATVRPVAALCLAALGLALVPADKSSRFAFAIGLAVAVVAPLDLGQDLLGFDLGVNRWLAPQVAVPGPGSASVWMTNGTALALAGGSLVLSRFEGRRLAATVLGGIAGAIAVFALLNYLPGIDALYGSGSASSPGLPIAVGLLCVAGGIIARIGTMPGLGRPRPLRHLLVMLGCAIVAPLLLFGAYAGFRIADGQFRDDRDDLTVVARYLSAGVDREIVGEIERLQALAASASLRQGDYAEFQRQAEASLVLRQSGNIMLVDHDMQQLVDTWVPFGTSLEKAAMPESVERAFATGKPQVTGLFMGPVVKQLLIAIIVPVQIDGESRYALVRSPGQRTLAGLITANGLPPGWHAVVYDASHRVIARSEQEDAFIGQELPLAQWHRAAPEGVLEFADSEGQPSLEAYAWSQLTGWETAVWAPKALLEAPFRALWWTVGAMALLAIALVVALASWLGQIIARSVSHAAYADGPLRGGTPVIEVDRLMAELRGTAAKRQAAEDALRESERQLRLVTDNALVAIARCDMEARYKFVNKHYAERLGLTPDRVIGKSIAEVLGKKAYAILDPYIHECLAGKAVKFETEVPYRIGGPQFMHCCYEPEWRDGKVVGLVAAITNISDLKRAEAALRESEATYRAMFDVSSVGKIEVKPESGRFLRANAAMCKFVGYTEAELLGRTLFDITHPDDRDHAHELLRRMIAGKSAVSDLEKRCIRKDGSAVWARVTANVVRDGSGRALRYIAVIQDINARKQAQQALYTSNSRLQLALDAAQLGWWHYDPHHRTLSGDARSKEVFDIAADEMPAEVIKRRVHPDDAERFEVAREVTLASIDQKSHAMEFRLQRIDGDVRWLEVHWLTHFEGNGHERRAVSVVGTVADITKRKKREEKEHLLIREINHRAKNMLSVVHAIARQTATNNLEDFIGRFSERIQALSASQDLLVRNDWNGVEIEELVRTQLAPFADLIGSRIAVRGPKLCLKAASAQAIGLVIHELATNAGKYGALSTHRGRVNVCWRIEGNTFTMSWTESDGPSVPAPGRRGFGTMVMQAMAEHSVDGTVDLDYASSGVTWRLICPAANALEPAEREQEVALTTRLAKKLEG
ncbi:MAG TPA: PAS domain S-box protein [Xanthobacteraceae bacterium]|nr:PAS domain S-box protein [Xanthobacteraceae bacterium]